MAIVETFGLHLLEHRINPTCAEINRNTDFIERYWEFLQEIGSSQEECVGEQVYKKL